MNERDFRNFSDEEFERFLQQETSGLNVSEKVVKSVNPWRKSTNMIFAGIILQIFTFPVYYLNYILPAIGMLLVLFGFRMLSGENKWFKAGTAAAFVDCIVWSAARISNSIMWQDDSLHERFHLFLGYFSAFMMLAVIGCIWGGFRKVQKKSGVKVHTLSFAMLFFAYFLLMLAARIPEHVFPLTWIFIAAFIAIFISIGKIFRKISVSGYAIYPKPVRIPNYVLVIVLAAVTAAGIFVGYTFFTSYPMDYRPVKESTVTQVQQAEAQLLEKGFPEEILEMLTDEDIAQCENPVRVVVKREGGHSGNDWHENITLRTVEVQLDRDKETWKIINSFQWDKPLKRHYSDCIQFEPFYCAEEKNYWIKSGNITGQVLYDKDGETFASLYDIREGVIGKSKNPDDILVSMWGSSEGRRQVVGEFTFPAGAENSRGYIAYNVENIGGATREISYFTYTHDDKLTYPYKKTSDYRWESTVLQHYNSELEQYYLIGEKSLESFPESYTAEGYTVYQ